MTYITMYSKDRIAQRFIHEKHSVDRTGRHLCTDVYNIPCTTAFIQRVKSIGGRHMTRVLYTTTWTKRKYPSVIVRDGRIPGLKVKVNKDVLSWDTRWR